MSLHWVASPLAISIDHELDGPDEEVVEVVEAVLDVSHHHQQQD